MRKSSKISNEIEFTTSADSRKISQRYPFNTDGVKDEVLRLYDLAYDALKIITVALSMENSDFFADFHNLEQFYRIFEIFGINTGDFKPSEENFSSNPIKEWIEIISLLFVTIESMPNEGGICNERIVYGGKSCNYLTLCVDTETMDFKSHVLGLMIDENSSILMIDNNAIITTLS